MFVSGGSGDDVWAMGLAHAGSNGQVLPVWDWFVSLVCVVDFSVIPPPYTAEWSSRVFLEGF